MRIAYLSRAHTFHKSGAHRFHHNTVLPFLVEQGHDVTLITASTSPHKNSLASDNSENYLVETIANTRHTGFSLSLLVGFRKKVSRGGFDLVIASSWSGLLLPRNKGPRVIHFFHNSWTTMQQPIERKESKVSEIKRRYNRFAQKLLWLTRAALVLASKTEVVFPSRFTKEAFERDTAFIRKIVPESSFRVAYNPVILEVDGNCDGISSEKKVGLVNIGFLGRLSPQKGILHLFDILEALDAKLDREVCLHIAGPIDDENYFNLIKQRRHALKAKLERGRVCLCGPVQKQCAIQFFKSLDLAIFPSLVQEGFSLAVLEAMVSGTPILAYESGGTAEALKFGELGTIVSQGNVEAMKEQALYILNNIDRYKDLARKAEEDATSNYTVEKHVQTLFSRGV